MRTDVISLFRRQHGVASLCQLTELEGITRAMIDGLAARGRLVRVARGVMMVPGAPMTPESEAMIAVLRSGEGSRLIGPRALALVGLRGFARTDEFGVLVPGTRKLPTKVDHAVFRDPDPDDGTALANDLPVPLPARLVIEASRFFSGNAMISVLDAARWERRPSTPALVSRLADLPRGYAPAARVKDLIVAGALGTESWGERGMFDAIGDEFGPIERQVNVTARHRADGLLRKHGVILEYQGRDHRTEAGRTADRARQDEIEEATGMTVFEVFWEDLAEPAALRARLRQVIRARRSRLA